MSLFRYNNILSEIYNYPYQTINEISNPLLNYIYYPTVFIDRPHVTEDKYTYTIEMPGMSKDDVSVTIEDDNIMIIEGENDTNKIYKTYNLPVDGDDDNVVAKIKCGLLKVIVPRLYKNRTKTIKVQ